jgi:release factor glutamine methyltransferase
MTLAEKLQQAEAQLQTGPHPERARRDAETLLLHHTGKSRAWLLAHLKDDFGGCAAIGYAALIDRRRRGEPIQYITGEAEFYGLLFRVTPDVLIPRPETEHLVEQAIALARPGCPIHAQPYRAWVGKRERPQSTSCRILDIGTGSGAIAIALAHNLPNAQITATDVSAAALAIACENAERNQVSSRIRFLQGDLLAPVAGEFFDLIVSNPPYVSNSDRNTLAIEVRDHEPALALFAGNDGLDIYRRLIPAAFKSLVPGGCLLLEIGFGQEPAIRGLLTSAGFQNIDFHPDLQSIPRVAVAQRP